MDSKKVIYNLSKVKACYLKGQSFQAVNHTVLALKEIVEKPSSAPLSVNIRSLIREAMQFLSRDEKVTSKTTTSLAYSPGQEKVMLKNLLRIHCQFAEALQENREQTRERKLKLDKAYNLGLRLLAANKISEADQAFQMSVKCYKTEKKLFSMIADALIKAGQEVRATTYLKKAIELEPDSEKLLATINKIKAKTQSS